MADNVSKNKARMVVLTIFIVGFAAGVLSMNLYERLRSNKAPENGKPQDFIIHKMEDRLSLTSDQESKIRSILNETFDQYKQIRVEMDPKLKEFEPKFAEVRAKSRDRIREVITDKQKPELEKMFEESDKEREARKNRQ
jgi:hypothetical protein